MHTLGVASDACREFTETQTLNLHPEQVWFFQNDRKSANGHCGEVAAAARCVRGSTQPAAAAAAAVLGVKVCVYIYIYSRLKLKVGCFAQR